METFVHCPQCQAECSTSDQFCRKCGYKFDYQPQPESKPDSEASKSQQTPILQKADQGRRLGAYLIDGLIIFVLGLPAWILFFVPIFVTAAAAVSSIWTFWPFPIFLSVTLFLLSLLLPFLYSLLKDGFSNGQSIGKRVVGIRVVTVRDQKPCGKGTSCLRNLVSSLIAGIPMVGWLIEPIMVLASSDGRKIGDLAAGTMVINV